MFSRGLLAFVLAAAPACYGTERYDVPIGEVEVTSAPMEAVEAGPAVIYANRPHYYDGLSWFYFDHGHWYTYEHEPRELREFRRRNGMP
jgi:hypothetical protein